MAEFNLKKIFLFTKLKLFKNEIGIEETEQLILPETLKEWKTNIDINIAWYHEYQAMILEMLLRNPFQILNILLQTMFPSLYYLMP